MDETEKMQDSGEINKNDKGPVFGMRHVQFIFFFFIGIIVYSTRFGFSVALVAMTQNYSSNPDIPVYNWPKKSLILSTFFWGYVVPQIPIGILGTKFGSKNFLLAAIFINSVCMISIPTVAEHFGAEGVMTCRIIQGFAQGFIIPCSHGSIGKWAAPTERARVYGFLATGYTIGTVLGLTTTGIICSSWAGWPLTFYLIPSMGFLWILLYFFYGASSPATHKIITEREKTYIQTTLESQDIYNVAIPYRSIFTSTPFWAQVVMALCSGWGFCIFTTEMPIYMDKVMKFNIQSNGVISSLPSVFNIVSVNVTAFTADYLIKNSYFTVGGTRKLLSSIGSIGCAILLLAFVWVPNDSKTLCVVVLISAYCVRSLNSGGYMINHLDLAPNFAGTLMGFVNTSSEIFSFITPITIQYIVYDESDKSLWRIIFITAFFFYVFSTCFYLKFASGEVQPWNFSKIEVQDKTVDNQEKLDPEKPLLP